ncbi:MAG: glutathione S-transferase family protein [Deltaproteobacteria bacterium]|nr:MAG: glutathione S-transferase family protein [Deltaproteobacteria bacterium]TMQ07871.1 MAG: glutathione S-transferase family protein [Deltaproteobacteria bacterium]
MLLYHDPRAPNPRRVRIFLAEKGVAYDTIEVSIAASEHQKPEFRKKNPLALLPVLELEDGRVLRESMAICRYLEEVHPEPNLLGVDAWERAQIEQWNRHAELELLLPIAQVFRNTNAFWNGRIKQAPEFGEIMREQVCSRFDWLETELARRPYLAGPRFTVADITAVCAIDFGKVSNLRIKAETHPHLAAWHARVYERPSIKA